MTLSFDFSRCIGQNQLPVPSQSEIGLSVVSDPRRWMLHPSCIECGRREPGHLTRQTYVAPAVQEDGYCGNRLGPSHEDRS